MARGRRGKKRKRRKVKHVRVPGPGEYVVYVNGLRRRLARAFSVNGAWYVRVSVPVGSLVVVKKRF